MYQMYGMGCAWLGYEGNWGRINFDDQNGTWFQTGYTSQSTFVLEAYNASNVMIDSAVGGGNLQGNDMGWLRVDAPAGESIACVIVHDSGNYWIVDEMTGDMRGGYEPVPDAGATLALLGVALAGIGIARRRIA